MVWNIKCPNVTGGCVGNQAPNAVSPGVFLKPSLKSNMFPGAQRRALLFLAGPGVSSTRTRSISALGEGQRGCRPCL